MTVDKTGQAKPSVGWLFDTNAGSKAAGVGNGQQNGVFGPRPLFSGDGSNPSPGPFAFSQNTAPKTTEQPVNPPFSFFNTASSSTTSVTPTPSDIQMLNGETSRVVEKYHCASCRWWASDPSRGFCCDSCSKFYHHQCTGTSSLFGQMKVHLVDYIGLDICQNCHSRLQNAAPAPFPITRPFSNLPADGAEETSNARPFPRRSSRDKSRISRCESPDRVIITAEHFTTEPYNPFIKSVSEITSAESDEPSVEALFEINDPVFPITFPRDHPDRSRPFKVTARYFNSKEYFEDDCDLGSDDGSGIDGDEDHTHEEENVTNKTDDHNIDNVFGKHGWFYKLERFPASDLVSGAEVILWHEDSLELALEDDSDDDEDVDVDLNDPMEEMKDEVVTEETGVKEPMFGEFIMEETTMEKEVEETIVEETVVNNSHADI